MKAYIMQIVASAIIAVFADILSPKSWKKYLGVVTGIFLFSCILSPVAKWKDIEVFKGQQEDYNEVAKKGEEIYKDVLKAEFSKAVASDIQERIRQEFLIESLVEVSVELTDDGKIDRILKIKIMGDNVTNEIKQRISYIYDVDEVEIGVF